jgi:predicted lipid-binding transport protein (Tim44 family)
MIDSEDRKMSKWLLGVAIVAFGSLLAVPDVEARRIGGGGNVGAQRNVTAPPKQTPAKPAQQAQGQQQGQQAAPASTGSRWGAILGGLALGGLLGYFLGSAGGNLLGLLMIAGLVFAAVMAFRAFTRRRQETHQPVQFAGMRETVSVPVNELPATASASVPAGFDAAGFLRGAKMSFLRLQAANDAGRLDEIRELTTEDLYQELKKDAGNGHQPTQFNGLEAELLEVATEGAQHWASVRFSGTISEAAGAAPADFTEVWNLVKPADGSSGWLLAGIQQMH